MCGRHHELPKANASGTPNYHYAMQVNEQVFSDVSRSTSRHAQTHCFHTVRAFSHEIYFSSRSGEFRVSQQQCYNWHADRRCERAYANIVNPANRYCKAVFLNRRAADRFGPWHQLYRAARGSPGMSFYFSKYFS